MEHLHTHHGDIKRSIGAILISEGRLTPEAAERIVRKQHERDALFGEVGIELGLITRQDVEFAIARQYDYSVLTPGQSPISSQVVAAYEPHGVQAEGLRALRTQLLWRWLETQPASKTLSIISTSGGEGRSHLAANLAVVFSQLGHKTVLVDADLRKPGQHDLFGFSNRSGLSTILQGRSESELIKPVDQLSNLYLLPSGPTPPNPQELLSSERFARLLSDLGQQFDMVILDTPACSEYADASAVSARAGAALAVARKGHTSVAELKSMKDSFQRLGANLLGSVLVEF